MMIRKIILFLVVHILTFTIVGCQFRQADADTNKTSMIEKISKYLKANEDFSEPNFLNMYFIEYDNISDKEILLTVGIDWAKELIVLHLDDNRNIVSMEPIMGGLGNVLTAQIITMSHGEFIEVYSAGHMGSGHLELYEIDEPYSKRYTIENVIDRYHESRQISPEGIDIPNLYIDEDGMARISKIYDHDRLNPEYVDVNNDGNTDIVLRGIERTIVEVVGNSGQHEDATISEYYCKYVYIYDLNTDTFIYDDSKSLHTKI